MAQKEDRKFVIVLGRQFGCGARVIGKKVAAALGIPYYDKELLVKVANSTGVNEDYLAAGDERSPYFSLSGLSVTMGFGASSYLLGDPLLNKDSVYKAQSDVIRSLAESGSCLIVGRTADYILRDHPRLISIFIHASLDDRINRIIDRGDCENADEAQEMAIKRNKMRANYYNFYTDRTWGDAATYDLTVNASALGIDETVLLIVNYVKKRLERPDQP